MDAVEECTNGAFVGYGYSWMCSNEECKDIVTILFADNISAAICKKCGSRMIDTPEEEASRIREELDKQYGSMDSRFRMEGECNDKICFNRRSNYRR